jgi:hypothetical protein
VDEPKKCCHGVFNIQRSIHWGQNIHSTKASKNQKEFWGGSIFDYHYKKVSFIVYHRDLEACIDAQLFHLASYYFPHCHSSTTHHRIIEAHTEICVPSSLRYLIIVITVSTLESEKALSWSQNEEAVISLAS